MELFAQGRTLPETYHQALRLLHYYGDIVDCPDYNTKTLDCSMTMFVNYPLREPMISKLAFTGPYDLEQYRQEMLDGILDFEVGKGKWRYTYHDRMVNWGDSDVTKGVNQIEFVLNELRRNPASRRAVIDVRSNYEDMYNTDPACLQSLQWLVRGSKLDLKVLFRSNDAVKASYSNAFALIMLQKRMADELGLEVGTYTHRANSFHCYERDFDMLDGYVKRIESASGAGNESLCYRYAGDWDILMEECKPLIDMKVKKLMET